MRREIWVCFGVYWKERQITINGIAIIIADTFNLSW